MGRLRAPENGEQRTENRTRDKRATGEVVVQSGEVVALEG